LNSVLFERQSSCIRMMFSRCVLLGCVLLACCIAIEPNLRPIIGIVNEPEVDENPFRAYIGADYVWWLSAAGARIVPIPYYATEDVLKRLFDSVNGILFTGGDLTLRKNPQYMKTAQTIWNWAQIANDNGDYFPLWGTCQGFQLFSILAAQDLSVLQANAYDSENISLKLTLTDQASTSRFLGSLPADVLKTLTTENSTMNLHHDGVPVATYTANDNLKQIFKLLSTNVDRKGKDFGSTMEARKYPFYATQWHPERVAFSWSPAEALDKSPEAVRAMYYVAQFFVTETQKNAHKFPSYTDEQNALIYNFNPTYTGDKGPYADEMVFFFPL